MKNLYLCLFATLGAASASFAQNTVRERGAFGFLEAWNSPRIIGGSGILSPRESWWNPVVRDSGISSYAHRGQADVSHLHRIQSFIPCQSYGLCDAELWVEQHAAVPQVDENAQSMGSELQPLSGLLSFGLSQKDWAIRLGIPFESLAYGPQDQIAWGWKIDAGVRKRLNTWNQVGLALRRVGRQEGAYTPQGIQGEWLDPQILASWEKRLTSAPNWYLENHLALASKAEPKILWGARYEPLPWWQVSLGGPIALSDLRRVWQAVFDSDNIPDNQHDALADVGTQFRIDAFELALKTEITKYSTWNYSFLLSYDWGYQKKKALRYVNPPANHAESQSPAKLQDIPIQELNKNPDTASTTPELPQKAVSPELPQDSSKIDSPLESPQSPQEEILENSSLPQVELPKVESTNPGAPKTLESEPNLPKTQEPQQNTQPGPESNTRAPTPAPSQDGASAPQTPTPPENPPLPVVEEVLE